jgi:hypothetical protein
MNNEQFIRARLAGLSALRKQPECHAAQVRTNHVSTREP